MNDYVDVRGVSGASYRFLRHKDGRPLSPGGGNYLYGRHTAGRFELIFAGEVQNLLKDSRTRWGEAVERFQTSDLYTRLNLAERVRQLEHKDIVEANQPPMNVGAAWAPRPSAREAFTGHGEGLAPEIDPPQP